MNNISIGICNELLADKIVVLLSGHTGRKNFANVCIRCVIKFAIYQICSMHFANRFENLKQNLLYICK